MTTPITPTSSCLTSPHASPSSPGGPCIAAGLPGLAGTPQDLLDCLAAAGVTIPDYSGFSAVQVARYLAGVLAAIRLETMNFTPVLRESSDSYLPYGYTCLLVKALADAGVSIPGGRRG